MRGALWPEPQSTWGQRIIPADARSTTTGYTICLASWDHPRGCGEHVDGCGVVGSQAGSSPRMRGALALGGPEHPNEGIIPADAGSTSWPRGGRSSTRDHPRGCGEHQGCPAGSRLDERIIPADAGSTVSARGQRSGNADHPRGCGEHYGFGAWSLVRAGSSPRMRGARGCARDTMAAGGIIPADAGSTTPYSKDAFEKRDHPRGCGEHHRWS